MKQLVLLTITLFVSYSAIAETKKGQKESSLLQELTGVKTHKLNEKDLFATAMTEINNENLGAAARLTKEFVRRFPQSHLAPRALYAMAQLQANKKQMTESLRNLALIEMNYPKSSRAVSAKFLKAMIFKKIYLPEQSASVLQEIQKKFPGSPESFRAQTELKLLSQRVN